MSILLDAGCCCPEGDDPKPGEGTCCLPGNICEKGFSQIGCEFVGGVYLGDDAECDNLPAGVCGTGTTCTDPPLDCTPVFPSCVIFNATITLQWLFQNVQFPNHPCNEVIGTSCTATISAQSSPSTGCGFGNDDTCQIVFCTDDPCCCTVDSGVQSCEVQGITQASVVCHPNGSQFNPDPHWEGRLHDAHFRIHVFIKNLGTGPAGGYNWLGCPFQPPGPDGGASGCGNLGGDSGPFWDIPNASLVVGSPGSCTAPALPPPPIIGRQFLFGLPPAASSDPRALL